MARIVGHGMRPRLPCRGNLSYNLRTCKKGEAPNRQARLCQEASTNNDKIERFHCGKVVSMRVRLERFHWGLILERMAR